MFINHFYKKQMRLQANQTACKFRLQSKNMFFKTVTIIMGNI